MVIDRIKLAELLREWKEAIWPTGEYPARPDWCDLEAAFNAGYLEGRTHDTAAAGVKTVDGGQR
jgi:hypothetical protein